LNFAKRLRKNSFLYMAKAATFLTRSTFEIAQLF